MKKICKKGLALLLTLVMVVSLLGTGGLLPVAQAYDYSGFNEKVNQIKTQYPEGTTWTNSNSYPSGWFGCWAFANIMANAIFGTSTPSSSAFINVS